MTTRVLASSLASPSMRFSAPPSLLKHSFHLNQLSHLRPQATVPFIPHSRGHTRPLSWARHHYSTASSPASKAVAVAISAPKAPIWRKVAIGGTVALATSATLLNQLAKSPQMEAADYTASSSSSGNVILDLMDEYNRIGVEKKSTADLLLSMLVYKLCTLGLLVEMAPKLISLAEVMHLTAPVYWVVRKTFFAYFCGGESADDCIGTMSSLKSAGINSILDLSVEADLNATDLHTQTPGELRAMFNKSADNIAEQTSDCIQTASNMSKAFCAIKITAMASPLLLQQVSVTLNTLENKFKNMDQNKSGKVTKEEFKLLVKMLPNPSLYKGQSMDAMVDQLFQEADKDQDGQIDWVDFASTVSLNRDETRGLFMANTADSEIPGFEREDLEDYKRVLVRMEKLCAQAQKTHTRLMIDAEQSYFQPAIDAVALHLMENFNNTPTADGPLIFNTYQMYLKDALGRLQQDYTRAQRNGYVLAAKLVRGAYMVSERKRALELGLEDPICNGVEATHASYDAGVDFMLTMMSQQKQKMLMIKDSEDKEESTSPLKNTPVVLFVASHNKNSIIRTCERMQELELAPESGHVMFGQLMGMCDQISYTLGQYGYGIYKYVPYGPIHHVIPYLIRRAQENASVLGGVNVERSLLWMELMSRLLPQSTQTQIQTVTTPVVPTGPTTTLENVQV